MVMISGDTLMKLLTIPGKRVNRKLSEDRVTWKNVDQPYPGTAVGIDLRVADEQGFEDLFKGIRQAYNLNIKQTKNARYKARFKK